MTTSYKMRSMPAANCHVEIIRDSKTNAFKGVYLYSYRTLMMEICFDPETYVETVKLYYPVDCSRTTARHVNRFTTEWLGENCYFKLKGKEKGYTMSANWGVRDTLEMLQWYENSGKRFRY